MADEEKYHINIIFNYEKAVKNITSIEKKLNKLSKTLGNLGDDRKDISNLAFKLKNVTLKLPIESKEVLEKISFEIIDKIVDRYLSFEKLDGRPVGETGALERALKNKETNVKVEGDSKETVANIMNISHLTSETPSRGSHPYYIYQNVGAGPREERNFIMKMTSAADEILESDMELIIETLEDFVEDYFDPLKL